MRNRFRVIGALALVVALGACASTGSNEIGLHYDDGPWEGQHFNQIIEPGSGSAATGFGDWVTKLPTDQRTYRACPATGDDVPEESRCDHAPFRVTALGGAELDFEVAMTFKLNTGCASNDDCVILDFNENICRKTDCTSGDGWDGMLDQYIGGPTESSLQERVREFTPDELYAGVPAGDLGELDADAVSSLSRLEAALEEDIGNIINDFAGGPYFCGPGFNRANPSVCPSFQLQITNVVPVDEGVRQSFNERINAANRAESRVTDATSLAESSVIAAQGEADAAALQASIASIPGLVELIRARAMQDCARNPECTLIFAPAGVNIEDVTDGVPG